MENYEEIVKKLNKELRELKKTFVTTTDCKNIAVKNYEEIKGKVTKQESVLTELYNQRKEMPYSNDQKLSMLAAMLMIIVSILAMCGSVALFAFLAFKLLSFPALIAIVASAFSYLGSLLLICILANFGFKILENYLKKKSYNKIINSKKYGKLLEKIKQEEDELGKLLSQEYLRSLEMIEASSKYNDQLKVITDKKNLLSYIRKEMRAQSQSELEQPSKGYSRKRKK